ncbi:hypothetical protein [Arenimonas oryziterrae]|uniref:Uncharacterized protein n=1 Tax=Arenimonas oryziterrae DSM 21050 = YC6267 TaxID=1121015 RepID=A0A091BAF0_9GAMM|nr:hypothetical protein [Arenimonas oryziterrae]KFN41410.1 hypothetical protein N789_05910 [Arenimonas oryziterrae DSM 21050 = YC6267]
MQALSPLEKVSVHYNWTEAKGVACVRYDGIYFDKSAPTAQSFRTFRGETCRHPQAAGTLVQVELSEHTASREAAYQVDLMELTDEVFDGIRFTEPPATTTASPTRG